MNEAQQRVQIDRHVGGSNDALDARSTGRRGIVDRANSRVRVGASQNLEVEQIGEAMVVVISRGSGDVAEHVLALRRLSDFLQVVVALIGEYVLANLEHGGFLQARRAAPRAASRIAAMIGS